MSRNPLPTALAFVAALFLGGTGLPGRLPELVLPASAASPPASERLTIVYPLEQTLFPPDIAPPLFRWTDQSGADKWRIDVSFGDSTNAPATPRASPRTFVFESQTSAWSPPPEAWETLKRESLSQEAHVTVTGRRATAPDRVLSRAQVNFRTSADEVGAPIFYREVILPFIEAVKDSSKIRWRLGSIARQEQPRVVLEGVPVCGNCHSFPKDGSVLAMDIDYANSKGSYVIAPISRQMALRPKDVISWDDFRREDREQTFGLLSQISPDGQVIVSTVKDQSVFVPKPDLEFSQLFFPLKGILAIYDRRARTFQPLPGADDPAFVQSNPSWSPDGKYIAFARAPAYHLRKPPTKGRALLSPDECEEFLKEGKLFQFDLYRIPYRDGQGGQPEPLQGAAADGFSNYFARYSPDGKWIVFCKARSYMLLQPDSALYIIPAQGGTPRRLRANTARMNSWHSWSPNSRWLVFSSKANGPYTQLFLTHVDAQGESSPPVVLANFTAPDRAANIPEFVNLSPDGIEKINAEFLNDYSFARAGFSSERAGDAAGAIRQYEKALELNPDNPHAHERLGSLLFHAQHNPKSATEHCLAAVRLNPGSGQARYVLGQIQLSQGDLDGALKNLTAALHGFDDATDPAYTPLSVHSLLGFALLLRGEVKASSEHLTQAGQIDPTIAEVQYYLAVALARQGQIDEPRVHYQAACRLNPQFAQFPEVPDLVSVSLAKAGRFEEALAAGRSALAAAKTLGRTELIRELEERIDDYRARAGLRPN